MARPFVSFSGLASWCRGVGAQLTAPTCSLWLLSKSLSWQNMVRAKISEGQCRNTLLRGQKYLFQVHRQTHCASNTQVHCRDCVERHVLAGAEIAGTGIVRIWGDRREGSGLNGAEACKVSVVFGRSRRFWWC